MTAFGNRIKGLFVPKEGEPWPPKWILVVCLACALIGTGWNATVAYRADQRAQEQAHRAEQEKSAKDNLLDAAETACDRKSPVTKTGSDLCNEVAETKGQNTSAPASIKFTDTTTGYTFICYAEPKGSADYNCTQLLP